MSKRFIAILTFLLAALSSPTFVNADDTCRANVYFIPFDIETYAPVTTRTIESRAFEEWCLSSHADFDHVLTILAGKEKRSFDADRVRMKLVARGTKLFVDANGVVSSDGHMGAQIDLVELQLFRGSLGSGQVRSLRNDH